MDFVRHNLGESIILPLFNTGLTAGFPSPAEDYAEETIDLIKILVPHPNATYYVRSSGDSMEDAHIPEKSILVVDKSIDPKTGDIVIAYLNGGYTVKYLYKANDKCYLRSANKRKNYAPIEITEEMNAVLWGVVTAIVIIQK